MKFTGLVPETGFEPARPFERYHLKVVRLPISPPGHAPFWGGKSTNYFGKTILNVVPFPGSELLTKIWPL